MFNFRFSKLYLVILIIFMLQSLEHVFVDRCMCLFIIRVLCKWIATAIRYLKAMRSVCQELQSFCNNTGIRILVYYTRSIDSWLHKVLEKFDTSVFSEAIIFVNTSPSSNYKGGKGVMIVPLNSSTLEINICRGWDHNPFFSAYSCIIGPISRLQPFAILINGGRFANCSLTCSGSSISQWTWPNKVLDFVLPHIWFWRNGCF